MNKLASWLKENKWSVVEHDQRIGEDALKQVIPANQGVDGSYVEFLCSVKQCVNETETMWFNCYDEFSGISNIAFKWNEYELLSLESAQGDGGLEQSISEFWENHLPIIMSVKNGYEYYAIRRDGAVVFGWEPEFEEPDVVADSFGEFIEMLIKKSIIL